MENIIVKYNCIKEKAHQFYRVPCKCDIYISYKTHPCARQAVITTFLVADSSLHHQTALLSSLPPLPLTRHFRHHYMFTGKTKIKGSYVLFGIILLNFMELPFCWRISGSCIKHRI